SRRRHTRLQGDWSSDVCSSDLDEERQCNHEERIVGERLVDIAVQESGGATCSATAGTKQASQSVEQAARIEGVIRRREVVDQRRSEERRVGKEWRARRAREEVR